MPPLRGRDLRLRLAEAVRAREQARPGDSLRVATWLDDAGADIDPRLLLAAARDAIAAGVPDAAERLAARAAPGPQAALLLAQAYALRGRFAEAEETLSPWESELPARDLADLYLQVRAFRVLRIGLDRLDDAVALVARARHWFTDDDWRERVELIRVLLVGYHSSDPEAAEDLEHLLARQDLIPEVRRRASLGYAESLFSLGRYEEMVAATAELRPDLPLVDDDDVYALAAWCGVRLEAGYEWDETEQWLAEADRLSARGNDPRTRGAILVELAWFALRRGRPVTAATRAREVVEILERFDPILRLPLAWLTLAWAGAMHGDATGAGDALAGFERAIGDTPSWLHGVEARARAALAVLEGEQTRAVTMLLDAAADEHLSPLGRASILHEALRAGAPAKTIAPGLAALATSCDAPLVALVVDLANAILTGDGEALLSSADGFGRLGAWLWAAESAALAAVAYREVGREDSARRGMATCSRYRDRCEDLWSPVLASVELTPTGLTRREREIIALAARGASNADIAERLVLSIRTVESHLYRAMGKLGVKSRHELRAD
jgi:DNA-binding CsgD family transcriptional regulator/tetratricopeptide (TPR) repeat protein